MKIWISFSKYIPQVWLNYKRRNTSGWSIMNMLLDLLGGTLKLRCRSMQLFRTSLKHNPGKLFLEESVCH
ncbi:hypothetical protein DFH28DRAFT_973109 [Melampsora americana]|nr:hypothetical protein DFH28DRAFT_973109 [Melampsora americana]